MDKSTYIIEIKKAAKKVIEDFISIPKICIVTGSGLSAIADVLSGIESIPYPSIPGFPVATVKGHEGKLIKGRMDGREVIVMKGRLHYYEGHDIDRIAFPIRVLKEIGVETIILTNAAGGVDPSFNPGDLMLITDHIGFLGVSPLRGQNLDEFGPRFPDQSKIYSWTDAQKAADDLGLSVKRGVYFYAKGPMYETPAEIRAVSILGGDAVGMSTVPEAIVASHSGLKVIGISTITNHAAGITDEPLSHEDVIKVGQKAFDSLSMLIRKIVQDAEV